MPTTHTNRAHLPREAGRGALFARGTGCAVAVDGGSAWHQQQANRLQPTLVWMHGAHGGFPTTTLPWWRRRACGAKVAEPSLASSCSSSALIISSGP